MPYMHAPDVDVPLMLGLRLVASGELVLVGADDVKALLTEGWTLATDPSTTTETKPPMASKVKK